MGFTLETIADSLKYVDTYITLLTSGKTKDQINAIGVSAGIGQEEIDLIRSEAIIKLYTQAVNGGASESAIESAAITLGITTDELAAAKANYNVAKTFGLHV